MNISSPAHRVRLCVGLYWPGKYPPVPTRFLFALALVITLCTLASSLDYQIARASAAEQAADIYAAKAQVLTTCERGATGYYYPDGRAFECGKKL